MQPLTCVCDHSQAAHGRLSAGGCAFCACKAFRPAEPRELPVPDAPLEPEIAAALDVLAQHVAFQQVSAADLDALGRRGGKRYFPDGTILMDKGDKSDRLFLVLKGSFRVERYARNKLAFLGRLGRGEIVGEVGLLASARRSSTVQAVGEVVVLEFTKPEVQGLLRKRPVLRRALLDLARGRLNSPPPPDACFSVLG
ncbi:MAG TPA: cyclic nucleotide-binding domain-containing protein [Chloroflexota bacterium]|nr:cyclic nucleotide-binding domain-containing protein [Chloroflexota bacterium]